jgi:methylthioribose-1-phosphate isomerase
VADALERLAGAIVREQLDADRRMAELGAELIERGDRVLTHCNTGPLATGGAGTAGGVIARAWETGRLEQVWVDETRPLLQGARLTAWELSRAGIPFRLVTDASVGALMARGLVDRVIVGADRIARNGDVANKIGTYTIAVLASRHAVPFYVAAPLSTIDPAAATGDSIAIEERDAGEVTRLGGHPIAPDGTPAANFAFDVTPAELVTAIVTEAGVLEPPFEESIAEAIQGVAWPPVASGGGE